MTREVAYPDAMDSYSLELIARIRAEVAAAVAKNPRGTLVTFYPELAGWAVEPEASLEPGAVGFRVIGK